MFNRNWRAAKRALWVRVVTAVSVVASLGLAAGESPGLKPGNPSALDVDVGDDGTVDFSFDRGTVRAITVPGGVGDDAIRVDESGGAFSDDPVTLDGDPGNDTLTAGSGADIIDGGAGDDVLRGGDGDDVLNGGSGKDQVDGGNGHDTLVFDGSNVSEHMDLSADSSDVHRFRDVGDVTMELSTLETADINATGGAGDGQPDSIIANGTDHADNVRVSSTNTGNVLISGLTPQIQIAGSEPASDTLNINTPAGNDTTSVTSGVSGLIQPIIDLGADE